MALRPIHRTEGGQSSTGCQPSPRYSSSPSPMIIAPGRAGPRYDESRRNHVRLQSIFGLRTLRRIWHRGSKTPCVRYECDSTLIDGRLPDVERHRVVKQVVRPGLFVQRPGADGNVIDSRAERNRSQIAFHDAAVRLNRNRPVARGRRRVVDVQPVAAPYRAPERGFIEIFLTGVLDHKLHRLAGDNRVRAAA